MGEHPSNFQLKGDFKQILNYFFQCSHTVYRNRRKDLHLPAVIFVLGACQGPLWVSRTSCDTGHRRKTDTASSWCVSSFWDFWMNLRYCCWNWSEIVLKHDSATDLFQFWNTHYFRIIPDGKCAWIGASNRNEDQQYKWIELPHKYGKYVANGTLLAETYNSFSGTNMLFIFHSVPLELGLSTGFGTVAFSPSMFSF